MLKYLPYMFKTLWRHRTRTALTVVGAAIAMFIFCFVGSVQQGLDSLSQQREASRSLIVFQANKFCPATSDLPEDYEQKIIKLKGVREVVPIRVFTNNCRASLDVIVFYGLPPEKLRSVRNMELVEGDWGEFNKFQDAAVVGQAVAGRRGIVAGETFTIGGYAIKVAGIFQSENRAEENYIYTHLEYLQRRQRGGSDGTVTQFEVALHDGVDADKKAAEIDTIFRSGSVATDTRQKGVFQAKSLGDLTQLIGLSRYLGLSCVGLLLVLLATTTVMSVQDRIREHAVLKTLGFTASGVFLLVLGETMLVGILGGGLGVLGSLAVLSQTHLAIAAEAVTIAFTPTIALMISGALMTVVGSLLAGIVPALLAANSDIVPALREN
jgi:putative ABC transport system permease protein